MPDKPEVSSEVWEHYNLLMRSTRTFGETAAGQSPKLFGEELYGAEDLPEMLEGATAALAALKEELGQFTEQAEEAVEAEEAPSEEAAVEGGLPLPALALPGLAQHFRGRGPGRAAGDIEGRKMVVVQPEETQLDILGVLRDIALIGLPFRGTVTKAIGSKL